MRTGQSRNNVENAPSSPNTGDAPKRTRDTSADWVTIPRLIVAFVILFAVTLWFNGV